MPQRPVSGQGYSSAGRLDDTSQADMHASLQATGVELTP
jgi:hypothetical protein